MSDQFRCCICRKGPQENVSIYRINAKGGPGIWVCAKHVAQTDAPPIDETVAEIVGIVERGT